MKQRTEDDVLETAYVFSNLAARLFFADIELRTSFDHSWSWGDLGQAHRWSYRVCDFTGILFFVCLTFEWSLRHIHVVDDE
jgi:hypothetical protein